jgi:hypothetical protein
MLTHETDRELIPSGTDTVRDALKGYLDGPVVTIELTPEQQAALREQSGGRIDATSVKLRPDMDLHAYFTEATQVDMTGLKTAYWNPPKSSAWVLPN